MLHSQAPDAVRIDDCEEHVVDADPQRQHDDRTDRQRALLPQQPQCEPAILRDVVHQAGAARVPAFLFDLFEAAEFNLRLASRLS